MTFTWASPSPLERGSIRHSHASSELKSQPLVYRHSHWYAWPSKYTDNPLASYPGLTQHQETYGSSHLAPVVSLACLARRPSIPAFIYTFLLSFSPSLSVSPQPPLPFLRLSFLILTPVSPFSLLFLCFMCPRRHVSLLNCPDPTEVYRTSYWPLPFHDLP